MAAHSVANTYSQKRTTQPKLPTNQMRRQTRNDFYNIFIDLKVIFVHTKSMSAKKTLEYATVELDGQRYAIVREAKLLAVCQAGGFVALPREPSGEPALGAIEDESESLAKRLRRRRRAAGLTQAVLASRAGIRTETLNRIERGKTEPDFRTVRKLVIALKAAEAEQI